jgi:hypothetical protein
VGPAPSGARFWAGARLGDDFFKPGLLALAVTGKSSSYEEETLPSEILVGEYPVLEGGYVTGQGIGMASPARDMARGMGGYISPRAVPRGSFPLPPHSECPRL